VKTFHEAAESVFAGECDRDAPTEMFKANARELSTDVKANDYVRKFIASLTAETMIDRRGFTIENVRSSLLAAFHMGVHVGMEMEKSDAPVLQEGAR
jgi:hypothetical protein